VLNATQNDTLRQRNPGNTQDSNRNIKSCACTTKKQAFSYILDNLMAASKDKSLNIALRNPSRYKGR
jgi:hypothetical protein